RHRRQDRPDRVFRRVTFAAVRDGGGDVRSEDRTGGRLSEEQRLEGLGVIPRGKVGPPTFHPPLSRHRNAPPAPGALPELARRGGAIRPVRVCPREEAERELKAAKSGGVSLIASCEPDYPQRLRMIDDPPPLLAMRGNPAALGRPMVAIVGARNASAAGIRFAERLARDPAPAGFVIAPGPA